MIPNVNRYAKSEEWLDRALRTIPLGAQTFSKSPVQFPRGAAPFFARRAKGSRLWDIDGNEYIDFISALHAVLLGYGDPEVNAAVVRQMEEGSLFTLAHPLEAEVAERLVAMVPCAEMVRYGKNGSDATTAAIRLARAFTGRDKVVVGGYHGWHDWYIGSTSRNRGVPAAVSALTFRFEYNNIESLAALFRQHPGEIAAVIMEAMNVEWPKPGFLEDVRELTRKNGALLIFDEIITGFRFAIGGAQELFGVTPDLATFGKGLSNGFPLAAVVGRADVMRLMEEIFFSTTMGGETLSLAAAAAVLDKIRNEPVTATIRARGERLLAGVRARIDKHGIGAFAAISGHPSSTILSWKDTGAVSAWDLRTLYQQETLVRGVLLTVSHNITYAHTDADIDRLFSVYDEVFPVLKAAVEKGSVRPFLRNCEPLKPLFKVR